MRPIKRYFIRRFFLFSFLGLSFLLGIILFQFTSNTAFTHTTGSMVISGHYASEKPAIGPEHSEKRSVSGPLTVLYGGLEFKFLEDLPLSSSHIDGPTTTRPIAFSREFEAIRLFFADGSELNLKTSFSAGKESLKFSMLFANKTQVITIPFSVRPNALLHALENGEFSVEADKNIFLFSDSVVSLKDKNLRLSRRSPTAQYGMQQAQPTISPQEIIPTKYLDKEGNALSLAAWITKANRIWERQMAETTDESTILAYIAEAKLRGQYSLALSTIPKSYSENGHSTYLSSPYLGKLEEALEGIALEEAEFLARTLKLAKDKSPDVLYGKDIIPLLKINAPVVLVEELTPIVRNIDISHLSPNMAIYAIEHWMDWEQYNRGIGNPFDRLIEQAEFLITRLVKNFPNSLVLPVINEYVNTEQAIHLYTMLSQYSKHENKEDWGLLGEAILLSLLSLANNELDLPENFFINKDGSISHESGMLSAAAQYCQIFGKTHLPHSTYNVADAKNPIQIFSAVQGPRISLDATGLSLVFPAEGQEIHYAVVRGIKPFVSIRIGKEIVPQSQRLERANASSWLYNKKEQALLLKIRQQDKDELVRITYVAPPPPEKPAEGPKQEESGPEEAKEDAPKSPIDSEDRSLIPLQWRSIPLPPATRP